MPNELAIRREASPRALRLRVVCAILLLLLTAVPAQAQYGQDYGQGERVYVPRFISNAQRLFAAPQSSSPMGAYFGMPGDEGDVLGCECEPGPFALAGWKNFEWPHLKLHGDPNDPTRHMGRGCPLVGSSWLNRPYYAGWLLGGIVPGNPTANIEQDGNYFGAFVFGKDIDHYWGAEFRLGFTHPELSDWRGEPVTSHSDLLMYDLHLLYYPWGDARWRPYATVGVGIASLEFSDAANVHYDEVLFHLPIGLGVKYQFRRWMALRLDIQDNIAFGSAIEPMHNVTLAAGVEMHFGCRRRMYYPWNPGINSW